MKKLIGIALTLALVAVMALPGAALAGDEVTVETEVFAEIILIDVTPANIDFGVLAPGTSSGFKDLHIQNSGNVPVDVTAAGGMAFYNENLKIGCPGFEMFVLNVWTGYVSDGITQPFDVKLYVPTGQALGTYSDTITFSAQKHT